MPASSHPPPAGRRRPLMLLRSLAGVGVLAGALSTLAGGAVSLAGRAGPAAAPGRPAAARAVMEGPGSAGSPLSRAAERRERGHDVHAADAPPASAWRPLPADPHPFAPGGDDLLAISDSPSRPANSAPVSARRDDRLPAAPLLWLERPRVALGDWAVLHLAAADDQRCQGSGALDGVPIINARLSLHATVAGQHRLSVVCDGPGGPVEASTMLTVPLPVAAHSAYNQRGLDAQTTPMPKLAQLGLHAPATAGDGPAPLALGDFLQQGRQSLFALAAGPGGAAQAFVLARDAAGRWVDRSAELLDPSERAVCTPGAAPISVDFNRDGRPDVWLACNGRQLLFLSQPDGRYRRIETPFDLQARLAEARDVDGDGWADIVTLDISTDQPRTLLLLGQGDGRFVAGPAEAWGLAPPAQRR